MLASLGGGGGGGGFPTTTNGMFFFLLVREIKLKTSIFLFILYICRSHIGKDAKQGFTFCEVYPPPLPEGRLGNIYPLGKRRGKLSQGPGQPSSSKYTTTNHNSPIIPGEKFAQTDSKKHEKGRFIRD
jgi:hypothetical protein